MFFRARNSLAAAAGLVALSGAASAQLQEVCYEDSIPLQPTNWVGEMLDIQMFDPSLGILVGIDFTLEGTAEGSAGIESLDATATTVMTSFQATLEVQRPDMTPIVVAIPAAMFSDDLTAYDGITDFRGTSGITHAGIQSTVMETASSPPPASDLALFTGVGVISLPVSGLGTSSASGSGNLLTQFMTSASCTLTVCYTYELDCNMNGVPDDLDIADGTSEDCNMNGVPDECEMLPGLEYCYGVVCPCGNDDPTAGCANSSGAGALLQGAGSTSITNDDLLLMGTNLISGQPALLFSADEATDNCVGRTFGDGRRCAGVNLIRLGTMTPDMGGNVTFGPGLIALEEGPSAGDTRRYQLWYRDPAGPCSSGFNLTNGYAITYAP